MRLKRLAVIFVLISFFIGLGYWRIFIFVPDIEPPEPRRVIKMPGNKRGVHLLLDDGRSHWPRSRWREHMMVAREAVGEWGYVTQLVQLDDLNPEKWQHFMDLCAELHLTPILRLATTFDEEQGWWTPPPTDRNGRSYQHSAQQYAHFVSALNWPTDTHLIIVGNEPNHGDEWGGKPDPAAYARFLIDISIAIRKIDPGARLLNAGLDAYTPHTGSQPFHNGMWYLDAETFMDEMIAAQPQVFAYLDGWASHPYPLGPFSAPPWEQTYQIDWLNDAGNLKHKHPPEGMINRGINGYEWELWKLSTYGIENLPIFITETGWRHTDDGYPDTHLAGAYLDLALLGNNGRYPHLPNESWTPWLTDNRIYAITPFALNGHTNEWHHTSWLTLDENGSIIDKNELWWAMEASKTNR